MEFQTFQDILSTSWGRAAALSAIIAALTTFAANLLHPSKKESLSLWLMGAENEENWSRTFCALFDAVFGANHFSFRCMVWSAFASLAAVVLIWFLIGGGGLAGLRLQTDLSLGKVLWLALAVNVVADYVSLLETRWLLGQMHRIRSVWQQLLVLAADLALSGLIIWVAILLVAPFVYDGDMASFGEIVGVFSIFSILFYSTFLTSVWSWAYIVSTWLLRLFTRLRLADWFDVAGKPFAVLGMVLSGVSFAGSLAISFALAPGADGLNVADRALCKVFPGTTCGKVARLTSLENVQFALFTRLCVGGISERCLSDAQNLYGVKWSDSARLYQEICDSGEAVGCTRLGYLRQTGLGMDPDPAGAAQLYVKGCDGGDATGCNNLGYLYRQGIGLDPDLAEAARLFERSCDGGDAAGCTNLGVLYQDGVNMEPDPTEAARLYSQGCEGGHAGGCSNLGALYQEGIGGHPDLVGAAQLYSRACEGGDPIGCTNLGVLHEKGLGVDQDPTEAARLYAQGCEGGNAGGCTNLGFLHEKGIDMDADPDRAAQLYERACDGGDAGGCNGLGYLYDNGFGVGKDMVKAAELYAKACDGGNARGCTNTGYALQLGHGVETDNENAARHYELGCEKGDPNGCTNLGVLYELAVGVAADLEKAVHLYRQGCDDNNGRGCTNLGDLYERGHGVDQNLDTATKLYAKGCENGDAKGCAAFERLKAAQ